MPALQARNSGLSQMQTAINGFGTGVPTAAQVMAQPGYQFGRDQGAAVLQNGAAANSGIYSGDVAKALERYGSDYGTTKYQQAFDNMQTADNNTMNRLGMLTNGGQAGATMIGNAGQQTADNIGQIGMSNATNQGAAGIAQSNLWGKAFTGTDWGKVGSGWAGTIGAKMDGSYDENYGHEGNHWADGGPVRMEPRVGTRSPLPAGGTGGGLSKNAILQLLQQQQMAGQMQAPAMQLGAVLDPAAVLRARLAAAGEPAYANGGPVRGPGGPRDDAIPVPMDGGGVGHLSNNEHVFTAHAVAGAGDGDIEAGHAVLNKLMQLLQQRGARHV